MAADDPGAIEELAKGKLKHVLRTRRLRGYPMNIPFTDVDAILTQVVYIHTARSNYTS